MKYTGFICVMDGDSNTVFERHLSPDEIIEQLLATKSAPPPADEEPEEEVPVASAKKRESKRREPEAEERPKFSSGCPECGSKRRHKKECANGGTSPSRAKENRRRKVSDREPFSEASFESVKRELDAGALPSQIASYKGLDEAEVRRVDLANDYEDYLNIA